MKISSLAEDIVTATYDHNGEKLSLSLDRNVVSPAFLREVAKRLNAAEPARNGNGSRQKKKSKAKANGKLSEVAVYEQSAVEMEKQVGIYCSLLSGHLIRAWDLTEDDGTTPVPVEQGLKVLSEKAPLLVVELWSFAMEEAQGLKKTNSITTLPLTGNGSSETPLVKSEDAQTT